jgi:hypothetical protein
MNSKTLRIITLVFLGSFAPGGCGGGSSSVSPPTSPSVSFSASSLTFGDEVEGTASEPLLITLTNTGTAALAITSIAASANFAETDNCGSTLAAGADCAINVTLAPDTTGSVQGTVTFTDNAAGSPQTVSLSGTAVTPSTLTGLCVGAYPNGANECELSAQGSGQCPVGQPAVTPALVDECPNRDAYIVDTSTHCPVPGMSRDPGSCQATSDVGSCSVQGQQCGAAGSSPCCSGFSCTAGADGSSCQPATGGNDSRARLSRDRGLADGLR